MHLITCLLNHISRTTSILSTPDLSTFSSYDSNEIEHITNLDNIRKSQRTHRDPSYLPPSVSSFKPNQVSKLLKSL